MTENEAKYILNEIMELDDSMAQYSLTYMKAMEVAIKALEEVQWYRKIGTPEECRAVMERQNPRVAITEKEDTGTTRYTCPACGMHMGWSTGSFPAHYCWKCGQKLYYRSDEE